MIRRPPRSTLLTDTTVFRSGLPEEHLGAGLGLDEQVELHVERQLRGGGRRRQQGECRRVGVGRGERELAPALGRLAAALRSEEHTSELQSRQYHVCRLLLEK